MSYIGTGGNYSYKYLTDKDKALVDGVRGAISEINMTISDDESIKETLDNMLQYEENLGIDEDIFECDDHEYKFTERDLSVAKLLARAIQNNLEELVVEFILSRIDSDEDFDKHKVEVDNEYKNKELKQNQALYDNDGAYVGTIKSVGETCSVIALGDVVGVEEITSTMPNALIKTYTLKDLSPYKVEYHNGKKIEYYYYGEPVESDIDSSVDR